ncbi:TRAP transporter large permease subunit [Mesorhizobium sp. CGMCC 1.15528]|uniref:TRAP transporter large permease subunit n=1 Tax=Mesorhizobium zhangyense TaxID=1776730 RepID=A0A7C9VBH7_9HYPH|nr:TRAP transporter large permease subunit [Mesorhizobium zhangyense]NGN41527.1 TRAP transporter large permease subunit [Mesorhizobium zhangyense]
MKLVSSAIPVSENPAFSSEKFTERLLALIEYAGGAILAIDVAIVFASVVARYFFHEPFDWAEEVASGLMSTMIFLGAASAIGRSNHIGIDIIVALFPKRWQPFLESIGSWLTVLISVALCYGVYTLLLDTHGQTTSTGLPRWWFLAPVFIGTFCMALLSILHALRSPAPLAFSALATCLAVVVLAYYLNENLEDGLSPLAMLSVGAVFGIVLGTPIAFALAFGALIYFMLDPSLPVYVWAQQVTSGADHFVLLAIPFFVLAGLAMEINGMSSRLIELLLRCFGHLRGGLNVIVIMATALFSGVSGSKFADIAAVGGVIMPAVRKTESDENETAGLLACTAVMAEAIPPCVNLIIFGFVSNISIAGLFMAGIVPSILMAAALVVMAIIYGKKVDLEKVFVDTPRRPLLPLIAGAGLTLAMIIMIGRGVATGIATSTEISAFAVVYAFVIGAVFFRELSWRAVISLFMRAAAMTGSILFIVAAASSLSYALTIERIPDQISNVMIDFGHNYGAISLMLICVGIMIFFGMVLEGAPAMILFGPLLTPIAVQFGIDPLQFGVVMVVAMGFGLFAPPIGVGLFVTNAMTGTKMHNVARPMMKYMAVLAVSLIVLSLVPEISLWLPRQMGMIN